MEPFCHASGRAGRRWSGKASANRSKKLNAWETCIYYCDKLAGEGYDRNLHPEMPRIRLTVQIFGRGKYRHIVIAHKNIVQTVAFVMDS